MDGKVQEFVKVESRTFTQDVLNCLVAFIAPVTCGRLFLVDTMWVVLEENAVSCAKLAKGGANLDIPICLTAVGPSLVGEGVDNSVMGGLERASSADGRLMGWACFLHVCLVKFTTLLSKLVCPAVGLSLIHI